ncbi:MAG: thiamine pyrophosphate-dependent enzyme [Desulfurella sp.]|uniref:thiamine pyrophosphate-dependent enzyme n=1 Tax=Desulfurella sp. TaxID=1962857 RepID=UPI003D09F056
MIEILSGNEAIAQALLESNVRFASAYPGTPSSEILRYGLYLKSKYNLNAYIEWSINEKVALEEALSASFTGIDSAFFCKQVGLNVALDPLMSASLVGTQGAFVVVAADDPGPYSSQTEQDSRMLALFAKIPVFDPSDIKEAYDFSKKAVELSRTYKLPVMLRTTTRISHGRQNIVVQDNIENITLNAEFKKDPARFAATPKLRFILHKKLNEKLFSIASKNSLKFDFFGNILLVSSGLVYSNLYELIQEHKLQDKVTLAKADMPYPLPNIDLSRFEKAIAIEETYPLIELQLNLQGRRNNIVPKEGELSMDVCEQILYNIGVLDSFVPVNIDFKDKPPSLCPGCAHRSAFFEIKQVYSDAIFAGDIGCYTLGVNLGVTDTVFCMGASVSFAFGFNKAFKLSDKNQHVVAIIGDSTFFHTGLSALIDAIHNNAAFLLVILDNSTVAMTGNQKTLSSPVNSLGEAVKPISIEKIVRSLDIGFLEIVDPYDFKKSIEVLKQSKDYIEKNSSIAVIIFRHLCVNTDEGLKNNPIIKVFVDNDCKGCKLCIDEFECQSLIFNEDTKQVEIDRKTCIDCAQCIYSCPFGSIKVLK